MSFLRAFGMYVPDKVLNNQELAALVGETPEWILKVCGIEERRIAADDQSVVDLAVLAAEDCLQRAGVAATDLGMLIVASGSSERFCPGPASLVAARLGLTTTFALDVPVASAGSLIAMGIGMRFTASVGKVLVIGAECMSRRVRRSVEGRDTGILFGDGAGACLLDPSEGFLRLQDIVLCSDGGAAEILRIEEGMLHMEGGSVILHAARKVPHAIKQLMEKNGIGVGTLGAVLMHQANRVLIEKVAKTLSIPIEHFYMNIARYGNTSSASLLIAAAEWHQSLLSRPVSPVVFTAFGTGLNWGALLAMPVGESK